MLRTHLIDRLKKGNIRNRNIKKRKEREEISDINNFLIKANRKGHMFLKQKFYEFANARNMIIFIALNNNGFIFQSHSSAKKKKLTSFSCLLSFQLACPLMTYWQFSSYLFSAFHFDDRFSFSRRKAKIDRLKARS